MGITVYCTTDEQQAAAAALAQEIRAELAELGSTVDVVRLTAAGVDDQDLPLTVMQVMALKGADTFPLTLVGDNAARSGALPEATDLRRWAAEGLTESLPLVTDATSAVEFDRPHAAAGGQIVVSDIVGGAATGTVEAKTRCETGIEWPDYQAMLLRLGFAGIQPLRVRAARYRDGTTARSVTIHAWHGQPQPTAAVDLVHDGSNAAAEDLAQDLEATFGGRVTVRLLDAADPATRDIVALLLDGHDQATPTQATPTSGPVIAVNGIASAAPAEHLSGQLRELLAGNDA
jgi:hypothetical protein